MPRATLSLACLWWLTLVGAAAAQPSLNSNDPGFASLQNFSGGVSFGGSYFQLLNVAGNGVGWRNGFTQIGGLTPLWVNEDLVIAANGRLLITDNQQIGGSIGGIVRHYQEDWDRILGGNAFFDVDRSPFDNRYRQGGFGIESLGQWWDFRANGYIPTENGAGFVQAVGLGQDPFFFQHRIVFGGVGLFEQTLYGGDFEFGVPVTPETPWLRAYSGMYAYRGNGRGVDPVGYRGRVEGWVADDLSVGMTVTYDKQFGTNLNANVNFLFSGWKPTRWFPNFTTRDRMLSPVQRNWRIATSQYNEKVNVLAYNPRTNQPYFVTWVDNSNPLPGPGDGTFENPLHAMPPNSPPADLILVNEGNTSNLNPLNSSIQLFDFQRMLGEGRAHQFDAYAHFGNFNVPLQTFTLPGFTDSGNYPWLDSLSNTVTLANDNEVSAFNLVRALGAGINNTVLGSNNFNLNHLNLISNNNGGINLRNATGLGLINTVNATNNTDGGIIIDSGAAPLVLNISDTNANSTLLGVQNAGITLRANNGPIFANLANVHADNNDGVGIELRETASSMTAVLNNVTATNNGGTGLLAVGVGGIIDLSLTNVNTSNNLGRGIDVNGLNTDITFAATNLIDNSNTLANINFDLAGGSTLTGSLHDVNFDNSVLSSGIVLSTASSTIGSALNPFVIQNVTADGNALFGLQLSAVLGSSEFINVVDGSISGNGLDGINQFESFGSLIVLNVDPTTIDGNGRDGYHFEVNGGSTSIVSFAADTLNDNGRSAVFGEVDLAGAGNSIVNLTMTDTPGLRSGADGMLVRSALGADITVSVTDGDFSDSGQSAPNSSAVRFDAVNSTIDLELTRTPGMNTALFPGGPQEFGLQANLAGTVFNGTVTDGNFSNNLQDGIRVLATNSTVATLNLLNVPVDNNGLDGMNVRSNLGSDFTANVSNGSFSNNGLAGTTSGQGLDLDVNGVVAASSLTVNLADTAVNSNELEGILGNATGTAARAGLLALNVTDTAIDGNGVGGIANGVTLNSSAGVVLADFTDDDISFNSGHGVSYVGTGLGASPSRLTFTNTGISGTTDFNGGDGLRFRVLAGNQLELAAAFADFSGNGGAGINGLVDGAGSSAIIDQFLFATADGNNLEGLKLYADHGGFLSGNFNGGSYSNNGQAGAFDGVGVVVDHAAVALLCFDGTTVDFNTDDGFDFLVQNGGTLSVALQTSGLFGTLSASNNDDQAVVFNVQTGGAGKLFMQGPNEFDGSGSNVAAIQYTAADAAQAAFSFSGTSDGNINDAINVRMTNIADAYIDIHGPGSLSNNGGNAIDIGLDNVTFGATPLNIVFLQGDFSAEPFNISDLTMQDNGDEAIKIVGTAVTMADGVIARNTIGSSGLNGAGDGILFNVSGGSNITALTLDENISDGNLGNGINILGTNSAFGTLTISNGGYHENEGHGINLGLNNNPIDTLNITGNRQGLNAQIGLGFFVDGSTFGLPFTITNTSTSPVNITGFLFDISTNTTFPQANFDTDSPPIQNVSAASPFTVVPPTEIDTGLITVNGTVGPNWEVPDESQVITATFGDFNPGESFQWIIDLDQTPGGDEGYAGNELIGSTVQVDFANGATLTGLMAAVLGFPEASQFIATGGTLSGPGISNNHGDGIHIEQVNSNITNLNILDNEIDGNDGITGSGNPGHGIHFAVMNNSNPGAVNINGNDILSNTGDGVRLVDPNLPALNKNLNITANDNTIDLNGGNGINLQISNGEILTLGMTGNTIGTEGNGNVGMGVRAAISGVSTFNGTIGNSAAAANVFTANHDAGFGLTMSNNTVGSLTVQNSTFEQTTDGANVSFDGVGLGILLVNNASLNPLQIGDVAVQNTNFNNNAADGFLLEMHNTATVVNQMTMLNVQANENGGNGATLRLSNTTQIGDGVGGAQDLVVFGNTAGAEMSGNTGHGLRIERLDNAGLPEVFITGMTFDENTQDGISLLHSNGVFNLTPTTYTILQNTITGNRNGIALEQLASARVIGNVFLNTITDNTDNGILISLNQAAALGNPIGAGTTIIDGNTFARNGDADGDAAINIQVNVGDNVFNSAYANVQISGILARQTFDGDRNGIIINNNSSYFNGAPPAGVVGQNTFIIQGNDLNNIVNNGITLVNSGINGTNPTGAFTIGAGAAGQDVTVTDFGGDGIAFAGASANVIIDHTTITHAIGTTGGDDGVAMQLFGNDTITIVDSTILRSGGDGIDFADNGAFNNVTIRRTHADENAGRGLLVNIQGNGGFNFFGLVFAGSVYNVGNLADVGANRNSFSSNGLQGMLFLQRAATDGSASFSAQDINFPIGNLIPGSRFDTGSPDNLITLFNVVNNDINSNGNLGLATGDTDGSVFLVGTNTRMYMNYSGNGRSNPGVLGNLGDDFRLAPIVSVNPTDSTENGPNTNPVDVNDGIDTYVFDPVAHVNLLFGGDRIHTSPFPAAGLPANPGPFNFGEQINVSNTGFAPSGVGPVQLLFTNNDVFKGNNRSTIMNGEVYLSGQLNNNIYIQNGVQQFPNAVFSAIFTISPSPFP